MVGMLKDTKKREICGEISRNLKAQICAKTQELVQTPN